VSPARAVQAAVARRAPAPARRTEQPRRPELRVVDPEARRPRIGRLGTILAGAVFAALFGLAGLQTMIINSQGHLDDLNRQITTEQARSGALRLQLADLQSPQRITTAASERLGMVAPAGIGYLQPAATDEAKARFDGATTPTTSAGSTSSTTPSKSTATTPKTTPTTAPRTTPTTAARAGTTPTTTRSATAPATTRTSPTTTAPSGTTR